MNSSDFEFVHANVRFTVCLCPDSVKTFFWDVKATKLGKRKTREGQGLKQEWNWSGRESDLLWEP